MKRIVYSVLAIAVSSAIAKTDEKKPAPQGFVSKKTGKSLADSNIEDITNDNFPDMIESFDYPNADVADVIKAISELTGKNFIVDPAVHGKITIIAPSRITVAEAYKAFLSALAINGMAIVQGDGFYKIKPARQAQRDNIDTFSGAYYPTSDQMITRIIKLKYISADEVNKNLRGLTSNNGEIFPYTQTNSLIVSDYGANIDRIMKILEQLDVQGFEEQMEVIRVHFARAKDISDLVQQIINKGDKSQQFGGVPRFRPAGTPEGSVSGAEVFSVVVPDERTNSIIVVGNKAGIEKVRRLVTRLDYPMRPEEQGGFFVYSLRHAEAEPIANMLNGIATESKKAQDQAAQGGAARPTIGGPSGQVQVGPAATAIFGGDVKVTADKNTNSLVVVASRQDYETIRRLITKLDIAKDQVYIKAIIMEMSSNATDQFSINYYKFAANSNGLGRSGFRGGDIQPDPVADTGGILGFATGSPVTVTLGGAQVTVPNLVGMLNILKKTANTNTIATPEIMAANNEESMIEVGKKVPVSVTSAVTATGISTPNVNRENVSTKLTITPFISPDTDSVKLKINQEVGGVTEEQTKSSATELAKSSIITTTRQIKTNIVVDSGDTAVMGGLMSDQDTDSVTKVPILGDIPVLGWLFKSTKKQKDKTNMVVFITPKIVRNTDDGAEVFDAKINQRIDFIQRSMNGRDVHGRYIDELPRKKRTASTKPAPGTDNVEPAPAPTPAPAAPTEPAPAPTPEPEEPAVESF